MFLFTFVGGRGHFYPLVPFARAVADAGHDVLVACRPSMTAVVAGLGFRAVACGPDVADIGAIGPLAPPDRGREHDVLRNGFAGRTARRRGRDLLELIGSAGPRLVVCDEVDYGAMLAAEHSGVPCAPVVTLAAGTFATPEIVGSALATRREEFGLAPDPALEMLEGDLTLAPMPPSFRDPRFPLPANAHAVRPAALDSATGDDVAPWLAALGDRPVVYVTLGTIFNCESGDLFTRILQGVGGIDADVVVTVGPQLDPAVLGAPAQNIRVERFVPQAELLPRSDVVVSHGGSGTVVGALAHGRPQVLLPMGGDQPDNAERCAAIGVGTALDVTTATPRSIADAVAALVGECAARDRAQALRAECLALPPAASAVSLLEDIALPHH